MLHHRLILACSLAYVLAAGAAFGEELADGSAPPARDTLLNFVGGGGAQPAAASLNPLRMQSIRQQGAPSPTEAVPIPAPRTAWPESPVQIQPPAPLAGWGFPGTPSISRNIKVGAGTPAVKRLPGTRLGGLPYIWHCRVKPWMRATHWGYAEEFVDVPLGSSLRGHFGAQVANGLAAQAVLYHYDFCDTALGGDPSVLSVHGRRRLVKLAGLLMHAPVPLVIEQTANPLLNEARRARVLFELEKLLQTPVPPQQVIVASPPSRGIGGVEAGAIYERLLQQTVSGGGALPADVEPVTPGPAFVTQPR